MLKKWQVVPSELSRVHWRKCGTCPACCTAMHIAELDKPAGVKCKHLVEGGCGIYPTPEDPVDKRPVGCQIFSCLWMSGKGDVNDRPDRVGAVLTIENFFNGNPSGLVVYTDTEDRGAWKSSRYIGKIMSRMAKDGLLVFLVGKGYRVQLGVAEIESLTKILSVSEFDPSTISFKPLPGDSVAWSDIPEAEQQEAFNIISELIFDSPE